MLLAVNVGNTNTVLGVFQGEDLKWQWRVSTERERTADELAVVFGSLLAQHELSFSRQITGVVISSVVPTCTQALREMVTSYFAFPPVVVEPGTRTGVPILTDNPREVGADRIVDVVAALELYGTAVGTWRWAAELPGLGIPDGNPPSGVASGYVWFDVMALLVAPYLLALAGKVGHVASSRVGLLNSPPT